MSGIDLIIKQCHSLVLDKCAMNIDEMAKSIIQPKMILLSTIITICKLAQGVTTVIVTKETITINPQSVIKYFNIPTVEDPIVSWMSIQKGIYPNTSQINSVLRVGEPITIFIYLKDESNLYDIKVADCWAYDDLNFQRSRNKLHLNNENRYMNIENWKKIKLDSLKDDDNGQPSSKLFLYTDLKSFKFPDTDQIYMTCDIQLCFKICKK